MDSIIVYHVVTEKDMVVGQEIYLNKNTQNGVYKRINTTRMILSNCNRNKELTELEEMILNNIDYWELVTLREEKLEEVRKLEFPDYPSRLNSLYVSKRIEDAQLWEKSFIEKGREVFGIVKLKVEGSIFSGDAWNCWTEKTSEKEALEKARQYWLNKPNNKNKDRIEETIVSGKITVLEKLI